MFNLILLLAALLLLIVSANFANKYATRLAQALRLPKYIVGFIVVAIISILPETFIAINSALAGVPSFGLGTLFGSNVADLTLVFTIIIFTTTRGLKISSQILDNNKWYPSMLALPILVGWDGYYSRTEGVMLIIAGFLFYFWVLRRNPRLPLSDKKINTHLLADIFFLLVSMATLLWASYLTVEYGVAFAQTIRLNPALIAMLIVGVGTTLPELSFSLIAVRHKGEGLALGDILGTVISDATIAVGIIAIISPFYFPQRIIYITAMFMVVAAMLLFTLMRSGKLLTKQEGVFLLLFYIFFILTEYLLNG
ncbi:MAG: hypothetical protein C3F02_02845 [Parcubacteria group bacterium]|nr:MAG: hypothetical protein C3F02_02845 [Parcubacteria group bacterium]